MNSLKYLTGASMLVVALAVGAPTQAADIANDPSTQEIIQQLTPPKMRGIRKSAPPAEGTQATTAAAPANTATATSQPLNEEAMINLRVQFEFNSDRLTPQAATVLRRLGEAIQSQDLKSFSFTIAGHTDAKGSADYNQNLSERRAASVKSFLVGEMGIPASRLRATGRGESSPLNAADPEAPENRRVEIRTLGG